jgi:CBS domain-containing protein
MKIFEIMSRDPYVCTPRSALIDVAARMRDTGISVVPVCEGKKLRGMITERDIAVRGVAQGLDPLMSVAEQVMAGEVPTCYQDQEVGEAGAVMAEKHVRRVVVLDREDNIVGILSLTDIVAKCGGEELVGKVLEAISNPEEKAP